MGNMDDWMKTAVTPTDDLPGMQQLKQWQPIHKSIENGELFKPVPVDKKIIADPTTELKKLRQDFEKYCADNAAYNAAREQREKIAERRRFWIGIVSNTASAIIGGLVVYYWPSIISIFIRLFH